jgi:hypothetical protein
MTIGSMVLELLHAYKETGGKLELWSSINNRCAGLRIHLKSNEYYQLQIACGICVVSITAKYLRSSEFDAGSGTQYPYVRFRLFF